MDVLVVAYNQANGLKYELYFFFVKESLCKAFFFRRSFLKQKSLYDNKWLAKSLPESKIALPVLRSFVDSYLTEFAAIIPPNVHFEIHKMDLEINAKKQLNSPTNKLKNKLQILQLWGEELINDFPKSYEKFDDLLLLNNDSFKMDIWSSKGKYYYILLFLQ